MIIISVSINLSWLEPADDGGSAVTGYKVEYSEDSGDTGQTLVTDTATTETEYSHGGLEPSTTLHYRASATVSATTLPAPKGEPAVVQDTDKFSRLQHDSEVFILVKNAGQSVQSVGSPLNITTTKRA